MRIGNRCENERTKKMIAVIKMLKLFPRFLEVTLFDCIDESTLHTAILSFNLIFKSYNIISRESVGICSGTRPVHIWDYHKVLHFSEYVERKGWAPDNNMKTCNTAHAHIDTVHAHDNQSHMITNEIFIQLNKMETNQRDQQNKNYQKMQRKWRGNDKDTNWKRSIPMCIVLIVRKYIHFARPIKSMIMLTCVELSYFPCFLSLRSHHVYICVTLTEKR